MISASGDHKHSVGVANFDLPLPPAATQYHVLNRQDLQRPLLSVGEACDAGCNVTFNRDSCSFYKDGKELLRGLRDPNTRLWLLPRYKTTDDLPTRTHPAPNDTRDDISVRDQARHAHHGLSVTQGLGLGLPRQPSVYNLNAYTTRSLPNLMQFLHACAGFPTVATWVKAIDAGHYMGWPGLSTSRVRKYLPDSEETTMGHQKLVRQGVRSTTSKGAEHQTKRHTAASIGRRRNVIACSLPAEDLKGVMGTDQTGRFPTTSDRGHKYIFVLADVETNYIHAVPIKSRKGSAILSAFQEAYDELTACGFEPVLHRIDHETSDALVDAIKARELKYEVMPPANHRQNPAEKAIDTFKSHFISVINGLDTSFPQGAWDLLIPQTNMTLNLLRTCSVNPAHSAYAYVHGPLDFNAHPLAPLGCKAIVHQRRTGNGGRRGSWDNKGKVGYYVGPAMDSYRVWKFYIPETGGIQETDTAKFLPKYNLPTTSAADEIIEAMVTIRKALRNPAPEHTSVLEAGKLSDVINNLRQLYGDSINTGVMEPQQPRKDQVGSPRVNSYSPRAKQNYRIGTRIKVIEREGGRQKSYYGTATSYDATTGMYHIEFDDGEYDEFNDRDMKAFKLKSARTACYADDVVRIGPRTKPITAYGLNAGSIFDEELNKWMAYRDLIHHPNPTIRQRWERAGINEFARLAQGYEETDGMDVVTFINRRDMPNDKQATYARYVVDYRPEKDEPWRLRITCGGDRLDYYGDTTTHSASMETIKCQLNNIISTPGSKCATGDISNMYLGSLLPEAEYVRFRLDLIPRAIIEHYKLGDLATNGFVYARVNKAWYGLKQAGKIAHDDLVKRMAEAGYRKHDLVEGYFRHETRDIDFTLVVDDFLIRYSNDADLAHLTQAIEKYYTFKVDVEAKQYVGIHLNWDYNHRNVQLSMDGYVAQALLEFEHAAPKVPYHAPSRYTPPRFGERIQYATVDESDLLASDKITFIQRVIGKLLYYARAVDPTMLHAINDIALSASKGTEETLKATLHLLNYAHTHQASSIIYRASDMILRVDSDAAYLVAPEARSRAGGYHYLSDKEGTLFNGPVLILAKVLKNVMASAAEAEIGALFLNGQEAAGIRTCLEAMGYPQPATPLKTDNSTADGIINGTMKQKRSKAIDMRFHWIKDRTKRGQFHVFWDSGKNNLADFYTKHHPASLHRLLRPIHTFIEGVSPDTLQGCIEIMNGKQTTGNPNPKRSVASSMSDRRMAHSRGS